MTDALPPIRRQQYGFPEIEHLGRIEPGLLERLAESRPIIEQRQAGRRPHNRVTGACNYAHRIRRRRVGREVVTLVVEAALVEIRPIAEYLDTQPRDVVEIGQQLLTEQAGDDGS
ncbi:hypothetical protein D9M72_631020 [compost metagenome]